MPQNPEKAVKNAAYAIASAKLEPVTSEGEPVVGEPVVAEPVEEKGNINEKKSQLNVIPPPAVN